MRFDEFLRRESIAAVPVERFDGFVVEVEGPQDWETVESQPGVWIWAWRDDPYVERFCANAVLTMHRVSVALDPVEVFVMLCDEQVHLVPGSHERHREVRPADDGIGVEGLLSQRIETEVGAVDSVSHSRIIANERETLIAQLTVSALRESPVNWGRIGLSVVPIGAPDHSHPAAGQGGRPVTVQQGGAR